jgi:ubiquinone/menaquinone biosynthesis C-methylase UbiE
MFLKKDVTKKIRDRYSRLSFFYDLMEWPLERVAFSRWRKKIFNFLENDDILEVGVGTGKNFNFYPVGKTITAIDFSPGMLSRAKKKAERKGIGVNLLEMDVQNLQFADQSFSIVLATFVFCSVPDPVKGLEEIKRVCKRSGRIILLEHVRPPGTVLGKCFDLLNSFTVRIMGVNINRDTVQNMGKAGLKIIEEKSLFRDIVKLIIAHP